MVMSKVEEKRSGCIKSSQGPWLVHKTTKDGGVITKFRYPSEKERQKNKQREQKRRSITAKIFAGLRAHGNYKLPKHADSNDLLMALCEEAGWHVDEDGNVGRKSTMLEMPSLIQVEADKKNHQFQDEKYYKLSDVSSLRVEVFQDKSIFSMGFPFEENNISLGLSL